MAKAKTSAIEFLKALYQTQTGGLIELRAIPVDKTNKSIRRAWTSRASEIQQFSDQYGHRDSEYGVHFGVCKRKNEGGTKASVLSATALWADIDCITNGQDIEATAELVMQLPYEVQPSAMIHSGGGLHLYWFLDDSHAADEKFEACNRVVGELVGGDNVYDITRGLRLPDTFNTKRAKKTKCHVIFCRPHIRYDLHDLMDAVLSCKNVIIGDKLLPRRVADALTEVEAKRATSGDPHTKFQALFSGSRDLPKRLAVMWRDRVREHAPRGYIGIHEAVVITTARLHCAGHVDANVIKDTMKYLRSVPVENADAWDWDAEERKVRAALEGWKAKWPALKQRAKNDVKQRGEVQKRSHGVRASSDKARHDVAKV